MAAIQWNFRTADRSMDPVLAEQYHLSPLLRRCLEVRGLCSEAQLEAVLGSCDPFTDPYLLNDMSAAVDQIRRAVEAGEKITVYGDYDVDGVTSSYLLSRELKRMGADCDVYIPDRVGEGYGMHEDAIAHIAEDGTRLIVTVDCGVTAIREVAHAYELGLRVVITDHHEPQPTLPVCEAVVDPKRADCTAPFRHYAGVGVAFKLVCALRGENESTFADYGDLVALGTVADVVSLTGENRYFVSHGLELLLNTRNKGLAALNRSAGFCDAACSATDAAFKLIPKLNAAGRMRSAYDALKLLQCVTPDEADSRASYLSLLNTERQNEEGRVSDEAEQMLDGARIARVRSIVLAGGEWPHGVIGISAAKLSEKYNCPVVLFAADGENLRGSARSVEGFDIFDALTRATEGIGSCGGHRMAAGLSIPAEYYALFRQRFEAICREELSSRPPNSLTVDCVVPAGELTPENLADLNRLEPFGAENERPVFCLRGVRIEELFPIGGGKHLRMTVSADGCRLAVMAFRRQKDRFRFRNGDTVDLVFTAELDSYRGNESVKLILQDIHPAEEQLCREDAASVSLRTLLDGGSCSASFPDRRTLGAIWRRVAELADGSVITPALVHRALPANVTELDTLVAITAFEQAGLIACAYMNGPDFNGDMTVRVRPVDSKADLCATPICAALTRQE